MQTLAFKAKRRLNWYKNRFRVNNPVVGRAVELLGNRVRLDGLTYSLDTPQISRGHKSTIAFGLHEIEERHLVSRWLPSHLPVLEFGGGLGVVSCLTNRKLDRPERHVVVEANPAMIPILTENRDLNRCKFSIVNKAIAYDCEAIDLNVDEEFVGSTAKAASFGRTTRVSAATVKQIMDEAGFERAGLVCDIEGIEIDIIDREADLLASRIEFIVAEMHPAISGEADVVRAIAKLEAVGFTLKETLGTCVYMQKPVSS